MGSNSPTFESGVSLVSFLTHRMWCEVINAEVASASTCMLSRFSSVRIFSTLWATRSLSSGDSPGKNTGVGCCFLLQGIFPTQGSNLALLHLLYWQMGSLPGKCYLESPWYSELPWKKCDYFSGETLRTGPETTCEILPSSLHAGTRSHVASMPDVSVVALVTPEQPSAEYYWETQWIPHDADKLLTWDLSKFLTHKMTRYNKIVLSHCFEVHHYAEIYNWKNALKCTQ